VFTHVTACTLALPPYFAARFTGGFNRFVTSTVAPVASGWSRLPGGILTHWESAALSRRTPIAAIRIFEGVRELCESVLMGCDESWVLQRASAGSI